MTKLRCHLLALPSAGLHRKYQLCGFSAAGLRFAKLLKSLGHYIILYTSEEWDNEAPCDELVTVITCEERDTLLDATVNPNTGKREKTPFYYAYVEEWSPIWQLANARMIKEIGKRKQKYDVIFSIGGSSQKPVADGHPDILFCEYSVGYHSSHAPYRIFESTAWQHFTYGRQGIEDARFFDIVIPLPFDPDDFTFKANKEPFALYLGRLVPRKGIEIACKAAAAAGVPLKVIGHGDKNLVTHGAEYLGAVGVDDRNEWLSRAMCTLTPTIYLEPYNQAAVESQMSGTPVVATDFGGFTETIEYGKTGFRCAYLGEFAQAIHSCRDLDPRYIRQRAIEKYSIDVVKWQYQKYFERLQLLWGSGWESTDLIHVEEDTNETIHSRV